MSEKQKIDLGALDPSRDPARWEAMIASVAERAVAGRRRSSPLARQIASWGRPALATAAGIALAVWLAASGRGGESVATQEPARVLAGWAMNDEIPETTTILDLLGGEHGAR